MTKLATTSEKTLTLRSDIDPNLFFQTRRPGLFVWWQFRKKVAEYAQFSRAGKTYKIGSIDLGQVPLNEEEIIRMIPGRLFGDTQICAIMAQLISLQQNGEKGALLTGDGLNLFYTYTCKASLTWGGSEKTWYLYSTHVPDRTRYSFNRRIFFLID